MGHISRRKKQVNWETLIPPQIGLVSMAYGGVGLGKTETIEALAKEANRKFILNCLDQKEPESIGGFPIPTDVVINMKQYKIVQRIPEEEYLRAKIEQSVMLIDEFTCVSEDVQAAALGWMAKPPESCWVFACGNTLEQAANGTPISEPMINRMLITQWKADKHKWVEGMTDGGGFTFPAPDLPIVPNDWRDSVPFFASMVAEFLYGSNTLARPEYAYKPNEDGSEGLPFPSHRSWTNLARVLGAATCVGANKTVMRKLAGGLVGEHIGKEFLDFIELEEYVDPETLLANPQDIKLPKQVSLVLSYVRSVVRRVQEVNTGDRWEAGRKFIASVHKTHPDIAKTFEGALWKIKPDGHDPEAHEELKDLEDERLGIS